MREFNSTQNNTVKALKALLNKSEREQTGRFLAEGRRALQDALFSGAQLELLLIQANAQQQFSAALQRAGERGIEVALASPAVMAALCETRTPDGILAVARIPENPPLLESSAFTLLCETIQDPGNLGTMVRTAWAVGVEQVILGESCADLYNPKTLRACMGAEFFVNIRRSPYLLQDAALLQAKGMTLCAALLGDANYYEQPPVARPALLIGSEGAGLTPEAVNLCRRRLTLPMHGGESLNAAVAAGILLYDLQFRNRKD